MESEPIEAGPSSQPDNRNGIEAFELPRSTVTRIVKGALAPGAKMGKDVPLAMQKSATVFISYLTAWRVAGDQVSKRLNSYLRSAQEMAAANNHKTLSAQHVLDAIRTLNWPDASDLERDMLGELEAYRAKPARTKSRALKSAAPTAAVGTGDAQMGNAPGTSQAGEAVAEAVSEEDEEEEPPEEEDEEPAEEVEEESAQQNTEAGPARDIVMEEGT